VERLFPGALLVQREDHVVELHGHLRSREERGVVQLRGVERSERGNEAHHALDLDSALACEPAELCGVVGAVSCGCHELVRLELVKRRTDGCFVPLPAGPAGLLLEGAEALLEETDDVLPQEPRLAGGSEHAQDQRARVRAGGEEA
jgi:hypothetical protein